MAGSNTVEVTAAPNFQDIRRASFQIARRATNWKRSLIISIVLSAILFPTISLAYKDGSSLFWMTVIGIGFGVVLWLVLTPVMATPFPGHTHRETHYGLRYSKYRKLVMRSFSTRRRISSTSYQNTALRRKALWKTLRTCSAHLIWGNWLCLSERYCSLRAVMASWTMSEVTLAG